MIHGWRGLALGVACLLGIAACAGLDEMVQEPRLQLKGVAPTDFSLAGAGFRFNFEVHNPNPLGLRLSQVTYRLATGRHQLVSGTVDQGIALPARGSAPLIIPLRLDFRDIMAAAADLAGRPSLPYQLDGKLFVGPLAIPYAIAGDLELPRLPRIELTAIQVRELSLNAARLACQVRLTNRNAVPLQLGQLAYQLQLGEIPVAGGETASLTPLAAKGSQTLSLDARVRLKDLGASLLRLFQSGGSAAYTLTGSFRQSLPGGGDHQTPFQFSGKTPLKR
ncbi:MAG: LEA type 2 family protein [Desulfosarcinaceae bacterium]|nr:LEA type 2 family protein [Desulfosarcinaceae bacterium]